MTEPAIEPTEPRRRWTGLWLSVAASVRTAWLVAGLSLLLLVLLELAYRAQAGLRRALHQSSGVEARADHPYAALPWFPRYLRERAASEAPARALRWASYVYWKRKPFAGAYINVRADGVRVTPQSRPLAGSAGEVWFFGGSTMWGTFQRDSATIPAAAAREWSRLGACGVAVTNYGEYGYVFTQEVLALSLALRDGRRPEAVVFLDGINDVGAAVTNGRAGLPQNEANRVAEFRLGRLLGPEVHGTSDEPRALAAVAAIVAGRSALLERLVRLVQRPAELRSADSLGGEVARTYIATAEWVEALASHYKFVPIYVWQPSPLTTHKRLSALERDAASRAPSAEAERRKRDVQVAATAVIDTAMTRIAQRRFLNLTAVFDQDTGSVFLDYPGHTTESGAAKIAEAITRAAGAVGVPAGRCRR